MKSASASRPVDPSTSTARAAQYPGEVPRRSPPPLPRTPRGGCSESECHPLNGPSSTRSANLSTTLSAASAYLPTPVTMSPPRSRAPRLASPLSSLCTCHVLCAHRYAPTARRRPPTTTGTGALRPPRRRRTPRRALCRPARCVRARARAASPHVRVLNRVQIARAAWAGVRGYRRMYAHRHGRRRGGGGVSRAEFRRIRSTDIVGAGVMAACAVTRTRVPRGEDGCTRSGAVTEQYAAGTHVPYPARGTCSCSALEAGTQTRS